MLKTIKRGATLASGAGLAGAGYMVFEAQWLRVRQRDIALPGLPAALAGLKLLHVSDLHAGAPGPANRAITKFVDRVHELKPDLVLFTGDMTDKQKDLTPWLELLGRVEAPLGKYAVLGNHDHGLRKTVLQDLACRLTGRSSAMGRHEKSTGSITATVDTCRRLFAAADIQLLENECVRLTVDGDSLQLCGVDDFQYSFADIPKVSAQLDESVRLRILLSHSPDIVDLIPRGDFQLVLAGHTHGGQICLPHPTRGRILLSSSGSRYGKGLYRLPDLILHVSPGVGTTLLPFRLLSRPEITMLTLSGS
ncbi:MAG: metallophosphoesterase [Thermoleophilia bacterium]